MSKRGKKRGIDITSQIFNNNTSLDNLNEYENVNDNKVKNENSYINNNPQNQNNKWTKNDHQKSYDHDQRINYNHQSRNNYGGKYNNNNYNSGRNRKYGGTNKNLYFNDFDNEFLDEDDICIRDNIYNFLKKELKYKIEDELWNACEIKKGEWNGYIKIPLPNTIIYNRNFNEITIEMNNKLDDILNRSIDEKYFRNPITSSIYKAINEYPSEKTQHDFRKKPKLYEGFSVQSLKIKKSRGFGNVWNVDIKMRDHRNHSRKKNHHNHDPNNNNVWQRGVRMK